MTQRRDGGQRKTLYILGGYSANLYAYVSNNPIETIDEFGTRPYVDSYPTPKQAALMAFKDIWQTAQEKGVEYGGMIYQNDDGTYSYTPGRTDESRDSVNPWQDTCLGKPTAFYHTHPRGLNFSQNDYNYADWQRIDAFLAAPNGDLLFYDRLLETTTRDKGTLLPAPLIQGDPPLLLIR